MRALRYRRRGEWGLFALIALFSALLVGSAIYLLSHFDPEDSSVIDLALTVLILPFVAAALRRYQRANLREKHLPATPEQFPDLYALAQTHARALGIPTPRVYLVSTPAVDPCSVDCGNRPVVLIGTDFYAGCRENSTPEALSFAVAHQCAHLAASHGSWWWNMLTSIAFTVPVVSSPLTRSQEITADRAAALLVPEGAAAALHLVAVGKDNYVYAREEVQLQTVRSGAGLLGWLVSLTTFQPAPARRIYELEKAGLLEGKIDQTDLK